MRNIKYLIIATLLTFSLSSCSGWLDIQPKTEIKQDRMFESESGFKDALIGAYILMGNPAIYGREMNVTFLDNLAQSYNLKDLNRYTAATRYEYDRFLSTTDNIWNRNYRIIANLNSILEALELKENILHPTVYSIIKAEALGLRAFLHFDILRMFGWGNIANDPSWLKRKSIPYVTKFSKEMTPQHTQEQVLAYINEDLMEAEKLLAYFGVYNQVSQGPEYERPNEDGFFSNRMSRFNYYAVRALQARVYMWEGKYPQALERLELFIDETVSPIPWVNADRSVHVEEKERDLSFSAEHIFRIDVYKMYESIKPFVEEYEIKSGFSVSRNTSYFYHSEADAKLLYELEDNTGASDIRYMRLYNKATLDWTFLKFWEHPESTSPGRNKMPLIKKPEMFYHAAECYNKLGDRTKAVSMINRVRVSRGIAYDKNLLPSLTTEEIEKEIEKEWRKEYIGEGQLFFYYKRLGKIIPKSPKAPGNEIFVFPLPKDEIEIGGREDNRNSKS